MTGPETVAELSRRRGWTQVQTAAALGVSRNQIVRYRMDGASHSKPSAAVVRLARAYLRDEALAPSDLDPARAL